MKREDGKAGGVKVVQDDFLPPLHHPALHGPSWPDAPALLAVRL